MPQDSMTRRNKKFLLCFSMQSGVIIYTSIIFSVVTCSFFSNLTAEQRYSHGPPMKYAYGILLVYSFSNLFGLLFLSTGAFLVAKQANFQIGVVRSFLSNDFLGCHQHPQLDTGASDLRIRVH